MAPAAHDVTAVFSLLGCRKFVINQPIQVRMTLPTLGLAGALAVTCPLFAKTLVAAVPLQSSTDASGAELAATRCVIGEEQVVPGDYHYCLGHQAYGEQHYGYARKFFTTAASWASKPAQYVLAVMALDGDHQPVNRPLALAWLALASERPNSSFRHAHDQLDAAASPAEKRTAAQWLAKLRPTFTDATAAARAADRYDQGMAAIKRIQTTAGTYCMEGSVDLSVSSGAQPDTSQCPPVQTVFDALNATAAALLDRWRRHVSLGSLQTLHVPADASPSAKQGNRAGHSKAGSGR